MTFVNKEHPREAYEDMINIFLRKLGERRCEKKVRQMLIILLLISDGVENGSGPTPLIF